MTMDRIIREEARLVILRALADQPGEAATSSALRDYLADMFMIVREREWVEQELGWLREMGAVRLEKAATVVIAQLASRGREHLTHQRFIAGVKRSSDPVR